MAKKIKGADVVAGLKEYGVTDCDITSSGIVKGMCKEIEGIPVFFGTTFAFVLQYDDGDYVPYSGLQDYLADKGLKYENIERADGFNKIFAFDMADFDYDECETADDCANQPYVTNDSMVELSDMGFVEIADILGFMINTYLLEH